MDKANINEGLVLVSEIYPDNISVLPLENRPLFPGLTIPLAFSGKQLVQHVKHAMEHAKRFIGVSLIKEENAETVSASKLYKTGTLLRILKVVAITEDTVNIIVQAITRFKFIKEVHRQDLNQWQVIYDDQTGIELTEELKAYSLAVINLTKELVQYNPVFLEQIKISISNIGIDKPGLLFDMVASFLSADGHQLQELLETRDLFERSEKLLVLIKKEIEVSRLEQDIQKQIEEKISNQQREFFLREELKVIKKELGLEKDDKANEIEQIENKIKDLKLSTEAANVINQELNKLNILEPGSPEFQVSRSYLNGLTSLPWGVFTEDNHDLLKARNILDKQHYGLADVKERILEFISTIVKKGKVSGSIICLVGPPGVGKTSIGKSIAQALGREFYRFSVGGMRDEAEIKGHRRTYIGAMPGKIIQSLQRTGVCNPVIMLDEIDKIGNGYQGDPSAALLEVLDPEQNADFLDHYLDVRFDLSNILFITTANQLDTIPQPLLDRMEIIKLSGYILEEKVEIAKRYLLPKQRKEHGLKNNEVSITEGSLVKIVDGYAREAGVRNLENQIKKIMRKATLIMAEKGIQQVHVNVKNLEDYLGHAVFSTEELYPKAFPGVVLGLAWTALGGATLYIEASAIETDSPGFKRTGQLGSVMQESTEIAYSYIRGLMAKKKVDFFNTHQIHLHVPAGATPKDGPSAGITMALALYSLALNKPVKKRLAMTGELTLTGKVLPIGGVKEKTIAARRVKVFELIFPAENKKDFEALPLHIKEGVTPHFVEYFDEVLKIAY